MVDRLQDMRLFRLVVQTGSLSTAGRQMGLSPAAMSGRLKAMEEFYGLRLLKRNTRCLSPTPEGQLLFENALKILEEVDALDSIIKSGHSDLLGTIGLTCPTDLGRQRISQLVDAFIGENPNVSIRLFFTDRLLDFVESGSDIAIRFGDLPDSSLIARPLGFDRQMVCCSPAYLARFGTPRTPENLLEHNCLVQLRADFALDRWRFFEKGAATTVQVKGNRLANDGFTLRQWAVQGLGVIWKSAWEVAEDIQSNRLVAVLEDYQCPTTEFHLLTEGGKKLPRRVKLFVDFAVDYFKHLDTPARHLLTPPVHGRPMPVCLS
ncbi:LysR family transcriptional regulator [Pseudomonas gingeri]|uniref:LysR family transcriptional regulator n=1 Tax=Pseudomonas gingeri TaxID=117681 RepID=A0A7Y8CJD3_9PSED|nr:LysR family transcriptional regulator [Pseudomonas gingeri]NVZ99083.1 LysR family transcriptional regulator [Pseudomonas gingeri]NWA13128.1 LysR family transcriptional regulator [Pseudomonas gingeri]NWA55389.1 LysR family transcriptional regulator [Pseudomonas gingeri]NWA95757.1 LysR family transcriptional regulator [Pseudomonas gingeri]NWB00845.1 LysR family transcriptional regulator [Pseudomonas gingeri]